jgi:murein DD-endopeptidase MepM/ murein hydrolase activator NlpD
LRRPLLRAAALLPPLALAAAALLAAPATRLPAFTASAAPADTIPVAPAALRFSLHGLRLPVAGVAPGDLRDTFGAGRSGGRRHNAIDIMAPRGTPVLAAADGTVAHKGVNRLGGKVLYVLSPDTRYALYYAHLDGYARGIEDGAVVRQGDTLGYVGSTGNAPRNAPHLHFQVLELRPGQRHPHAGGRPLNPFPLLREGARAADEAPAVRG